METYKPHILSRRRHLIEDCIRDLRLNNDHIHIIEQEMRRCIQQGLSKTGHESSSVKCFPTYVRKLPNGKENGKFLSLDLGGKSVKRLFKSSLDDGSIFFKFRKIFFVYCLL